VSSREDLQSVYGAHPCNRPETAISKCHLTWELPVASPLVLLMMTKSDADEEMFAWMESEPVAEAEAEFEMNPKFVDRVFKFMGFADGIETRNHVRISELLLAIAQS
jgi:hypothetical protein